MQALLSVTVETVILLAVILVFQIAVALVRSDNCPKWLKASGMDSMLALLLVCAFSFALAFEVSGLVEVGVPVLVAMAVTSGMVIGFGVIAWRVLAIWRRGQGSKPMSGSTPAAA